MNENIQIVEKYGLTGKKYVYASSKEKAAYQQLSNSPQTLNNSNFLYNFSRKVFLPQGYPKTVSEDYFEYQLYDTIQAFCSRITGTIATKSILKSVGVGNAEATPLSAAITWIFKDGFGMFSGIFFAWLKGSEFDGNCKKWRLFADIVNDIALFIEILLPFISGNVMNLTILCLTTSLKALVGVAGSATRAAVTQHQAIAANAADVAAKDGSQETAVNLVASVIGIFILTLVEDSRFEMTLFVLFTCLHLLANWLAVKSLIFRSLNAERLVIICKSYIRFNSVPSTLAVNRSETVFLAYNNPNSTENFCNFKLLIGKSFQAITSQFSSDDLNRIIKIYSQKSYMVIPNIQNKQIYIILQINETADTILSSYFHALIFGLSFHIKFNLELEYLYKRTAQNGSLLQRLKNTLENDKPNDLIEILESVNSFIDQEASLFLYELEKKGWYTNVHSINLDDWRLENSQHSN